MSQQLILAIGRESGSGGLDIARLLAERFGLPLYDKNILQTAAQERGVSPEKLTRYDEQPRSPLFYRSVRGYSNAPEDAVAQLQFRLLREHAEAGESFVVLGRCAEEVLADRPGLVSVFIRADLPFRISRTPLPEAEAIEFINKQDRQRRVYHDQHARGIGAARSVMIWSLTARGWESPPRRRCWPNTFWPGPEDARPPQSELYS